MSLSLAFPHFPFIPSLFHSPILFFHPSTYGEFVVGKVEHLELLHLDARLDRNLLDAIVAQHEHRQATRAADLQREFLEVVVGKVDLLNVPAREEDVAHIDEAIVAGLEDLKGGEILKLGCQAVKLRKWLKMSSKKGKSEKRRYTSKSIEIVYG